MSCPFYGCALHALREGEVVVMLTNGNQCALMTSSHSPCRMEIQGAPHQWSECPRNPENSELPPSKQLEGVRRAVRAAIDENEQARLRLFRAALDEQESEP